MSKFEIHDFYCMNCGGKLPLPRRKSKLKGPLHRKKLWCPYCRTEANMIEVRNYEEKIRFEKMFKEGAFKEELKASIDFCK